MSSIAQLEPPPPAPRETLDESKTTVQFHVNRDDGTSSLLKVEQFLLDESPAYITENTLEVELRSVDSLVNELGLSPDILKTDTQGNDAAVLAGAATILQQKPPAIISTEVFFAAAYAHQANWLAIATLLQDAGYRLHSFTRLTRASRGNLYFGDATWLSNDAWNACGFR